MSSSSSLNLPDPKAFLANRVPLKGRDQAALRGLTSTWKGLHVEHMKLKEYQDFSERVCGGIYPVAVVCVGITMVALGGALLCGGAYGGHLAFRAGVESPGMLVVRTSINLLHSPRLFINQLMQYPLSTSVPGFAALAVLMGVTIVAPIAAVVKGPFLMLRGLVLVCNPKGFRVSSLLDVGFTVDLFAVKRMLTPAQAAVAGASYQRKRTAMQEMLSMDEGRLNVLLEKFSSDIALKEYSSAEKENKRGLREAWVQNNLWTEYSVPLLLADEGDESGNDNN